jgi:hypothetical protein
MSETVEIHPAPGKCPTHDRGLFYAIDLDGYLCFACLQGAEPVIVAVAREATEPQPLTPAMEGHPGESYQRRQRERDRAEARGRTTS